MNKRSPSLSAKLAVSADYVDRSNEVRGYDAQLNEVWHKFETAEGRWFCAFCDQRIGRKSETTIPGVEQGQWHHPLKRHYFPTPSDVNKGRYSQYQRKSQHHEANGVLVCAICHGLVEGFERGRPHISSWLFKGITGQEVPLVLPAQSRERDGQWRCWTHLQNEMEYAGNYRCAACGHDQQYEMEKEIPLSEQASIIYRGRDVRAVHMIPPVVVPELMHVELNTVLLCLDCLFGSSDTGTAGGWKDEPPAEWARTFAPSLARTYADELG